jgi:hypothetical protein
MRGRITRLSTAVVMAAVAVAGLAQPASALPAGAAAFTGQGTLTPGYTTVPQAQEWTFSTIQDVAVTTTPAAGSGDCIFEVTTDAGTILTDTAAGSLNCVGAATLFYNFQWTRVGTVVVFDGPCDDGGLVAGAFDFVFTSLQPSTSYVLAGAMAFT